MSFLSGYQQTLAVVILRDASGDRTILTAITSWASKTWRHRRHRGRTAPQI